MTVIRKPQPGGFGACRKSVERVGSPQGVVAREHFAVRNPRTHHPLGAHRLRFGECSAGIVTEALEPHVRRATAQIRGIERLAHPRGSLAPEAGAFDVSEAQLAHLCKRSG